jgi:hypothetical protein
MATRLYSVFNGAAPGAAQILKQATGTAVCSLFQIGTPATAGLEIIEWGISFDGSSAATPGTCELLVSTGGKITTGMTNFAAADVNKLSFSGNGLASQITTGSADSSFNPTHAGTEVTPTGVRLADAQLLPPTAPYIKQFPLERGPDVNFSEFVRVRVQFGASIGALTYIVWAE